MPGPELLLCNSGQIDHPRTHRIVAYVIRKALSADLYPLGIRRRNKISPSLSFPFSPSHFCPMAISASSDVVILALGVVLASLYLFRDQLFNSSPKPKTAAPTVKEANGHGNPRDFVEKMKAGVRHLLYRSIIFLSFFFCRKNVLSSFMAHKLEQPKNTQFVSLRKPSPSSVSLPSFATPKNMTLRTWTKFPRIVLQFS